MKKFFLFLFLSMLLSFNAFTQAPAKFSYQAVVRDHAGELVKSRPVGMRVSILKGSADGTVVFQEVYVPNHKTNQNGLISFEVGGGIPVLGTLASIDWSSGSYFVKTETDPAGGTNYGLTGSVQLLSVPYAMYASNSGNSIPGPQGPQGPTGPKGEKGDSGNFNNGTEVGQILFWDGKKWTSLAPGTEGQVLTMCKGKPTWGPCPPDTLKVGSSYGCGIIAHIFQPGEIGYVPNEVHGIIVASEDLPQKYTWGPYIDPPLSREYFQNCSNLLGTGRVNTDTILYVAAKTNAFYPAAQAAANYSSGGCDDWFLPSLEELVIIKNNLANNNIGNFVTESVNGGNLATGYWSSSMMDNYIGALAPMFAKNAGICGCAKFEDYFVRPVRYF